MAQSRPAENRPRRSPFLCGGTSTGRHPLPWFRAIPLLLLCGSAKSNAQDLASLDIVGSWIGIATVVLFVIAYILAASEEFTRIRKSKPMILGAGIIWILLAIHAVQAGRPTDDLTGAVEHYLSDYAALFLFLLVAMTYVNVLTERNLFAALRSWLIRLNFSYRKIFWMTGLLAFCLSPVVDNLTTALLMGAVAVTVGCDNPRFIPVACINIVVAANAGGAFSPFGDITTLMVWQAGKVPAQQFLLLFVPSLVNFLIPAAIMHFAVPTGIPGTELESVKLKRGTFVVCALFFATIATALTFEQFLHLPPFMGMMTGLSYLMFYSILLKRDDLADRHPDQFNIFRNVAQAEWDTLLFFFGVIFAVGGLDYAGHLALVSESTYGHLGPTIANILIGFMSAFIDNIPITFAVLSMDPSMAVDQWLLLCLTAGVGGSLLSIGSAAGVALMGQSAGYYTFFRHLKWSWAVALGYLASVAAHVALTAQLWEL